MGSTKRCRILKLPLDFFPSERDVTMRIEEPGARDIVLEIDRLYKAYNRGILISDNISGSLSF